MSLAEFVLVTAWIAVHFIALWNHKIYSWGQFDACEFFYNLDTSPVLSKQCRAVTLGQARRKPVMVCFFCSSWGKVTSACLTYIRQHQTEPLRIFCAGDAMGLYYNVPKSVYALDK
jgi:hypothetical protein